MSEDLVVESPDEAVASDGHVGETLRKAREQKGLEQSDIAKELRLSVQTVIDIETHDFRQTHALTYVKGYLRGYARMVDLSADEVLDEFHQSEWAQQQLTLRQPEQVKSQVVATTASAQKRKKHRHVSRWIAVAIIALTLLLVALWWQGQKNQPHLMIHSKPLLALPEQHLPIKGGDVVPVNLPQQKTIKG
ncbi:MAG: helix-turn-helix domain-containing protein [Coxiellaceae bacterium]|nr:helix-turn-helix domain-containing protein [Coxiellaceae bacterium]